MKNFSILGEKEFFFFCADFRMTDAQREHASNIERFVPSLAQLRYNLRSETGDGRFWMVYFILLIPRLNEGDFEILSTPQVRFLC